ncbi:MAG: hypothetical protein WCH57_01425 [Verrucomicrobiota bacterium]
MDHIYKNKKAAATVLAFASLVIGILFYSSNASASSSVGQIDPANHYAWGENVGWIDFASTTVDYASTTLSGWAYGENIGFISLNCKNASSCGDNPYAVTDDNFQGVLGGYAWGENVGWIDFSHVAFDITTGEFSGYAYGENIGNILFGTSTNNVVTDWVPPLATTTPVTSCGTIVYPGTYTLGADLVDNTGACFTVLADNVVIEGLDPTDHTTIHTVTGNGSDVAVDARGVGSGASGHAVTVQNIILNNFGDGINAGADASGNGSGGSMTVTNATITGGISSRGAGSGQDGTLAMNHSNVTLSDGHSWTMNDGGADNTVIFNGSSFNTGTIHGTAKFYGTSQMRSGDANICNFYEASSKSGGTCATASYLQPYYFQSTSDSSWSNPANWYWKSGSATTSIPGTASNIPQAQDTVFLGGTPTDVPQLILSAIYIGTSTPNTGDFGVDLTNLTGANTVTHFYNGHSTGNIQGTLDLHNNLSLSAVKGTGSFDPNITINFFDTSHNDLSDAPGTLNFYNRSYNTVTGTVVNTLNFYDSSYNENTVQSATFGDNSTNNGTTSQATFNGSSTNAGSVGNGIFNNHSSNSGIAGSSTFRDSAYNIGIATVATFVGDLAENFYQSTRGVVTGVKTRLYTALAPQINLLRDFTDSAWTIVADNTLVKFLYRNLLGIAGINSNPTTTFVEQNGGVILKPLVPGVISTCGVLDTENGTYSLATSTEAGNYFFNYNFDTCFIVRANGVTINGNNMTVRTQSNSASSFAVLATSTPAQDGIHDAFTNLTIKNIRFAGFAYAVNASGADNANGPGGNGGSVAFATSTLNASILANGGNGSTNGGNGGTISISNTNARGITASTTLSANGGDSTSCGNGGNAGTVNIARSSYNLISVDAGNASNTGCPNTTHSGGSRGQYHDPDGNSGSSDPVADAQAAARTAAENAARAAQSTQSSGGSRGTVESSLPPIFTVLPPVTKLYPIKLSPVPTFGDTTSKKSFSLGEGITSFLFAPLPEEITKALGKDLAAYLKQAGFSKEQDIITIQKKPLLLPKPTAATPGLFTVSTKGLPIKLPNQEFSTNTTVPVSAYLTSDTKAKMLEKITITPNTEITIALKGGKTADFNGKTLSFTGSTLTLKTPSQPGIYTLTSPASPLTLRIEVSGNRVTAASKAADEAPRTSPNWFSKLLNYFF